MLWKRGSLTPELADLVFTFLPLDLSVADENDAHGGWSGLSAGRRGDKSDRRSGEQDAPEPGRCGASHVSSI